jgi:hypothetical protein
MAPAQISNDPEYGKEKFTNHLDAESHTRIFGEVKIKPLCNFNTFMQLHVRFNPDLKRLIGS